MIFGELLSSFGLALVAVFVLSLLVLGKVTVVVLVCVTLVSAGVSGTGGRVREQLPVVKALFCIGMTFRGGRKGAFIVSSFGVRGGGLRSYHHSTRKQHYKKHNTHLLSRELRGR